MIGRSTEKTPAKLFTGEKPDISHIRIFGSKVYSFIPKQKRRKWDDKAEERVLVGYAGNAKGYRILNPRTNKIWISRTVRIVESSETHEDATRGLNQDTEKSGLPTYAEIELNPKKVENSDETDVLETGAQKKKSIIHLRKQRP